MNILSPRERILKEVRNSLLQIKSKQSSAPGTAPAQSSPSREDSIEYLNNSLGSHASLFDCTNRFHFLDQFIIYTEKNKVKSFVCMDNKLIQFFKSCDLEYIDRLENISEETMVVFVADYFEPNGLFTSFNYNGFVAKAIEVSNHLSLVAFKDQIVKNPQVLFERVKNRIGDSDLRSVQFVNLANGTEHSKKAAFIIGNR